MAVAGRGDGGFAQQQEYLPGPPFEDSEAVLLPVYVSVEYMALDTEAAMAPIVLPGEFDEV